ncbi:unnamed protein product, partial [marine sediment metagenome]
FADLNGQMSVSAQITGQQSVYWKTASFWCSPQDTGG